MSKAVATVITSNGSHWAGESPSSIDDLLAALRKHTLNRMFESYGNFYKRQGDGWRFFGNFIDVSHVFNLWSSDPKVVKPLKEAIDENRKKPEYLAQPVPEAPRRLLRPMPRAARAKIRSAKKPPRLSR